MVILWTAPYVCRPPLPTNPPTAPTWFPEMKGSCPSGTCCLTSEDRDPGLWEAAFLLRCWVAAPGGAGGASEGPCLFLPSHVWSLSLKGSPGMSPDSLGTWEHEMGLLGAMSAGP